MLKENIRRILKEQEITQKQCSFYLNISIKTLESKLAGTTNFSIKELMKIKELTTATYEQLLK